MSVGRLAALAAVLVSTATLAAQSSVWEVTKGPGKLYLGGTCHVLRPRDLPLPREFDLAYARAQALYFETDIATLSTPETQRELAASGRFADGHTLEQALSPAAWQAVRRYAEKNDLPLAMVSELKPWMLVLLMANLELQKLGVTQEGVDLHFFKLAGPAGKSTHGLESVAEHLAFVTGLGAGHESEMVLNSLEELDTIPAEMATILAAWKRGDVAALDRTMLEEMRTKYPAIYAELILRRNQAWLPQIERLLTTPEVEFVLVGAGHLAGPDGLLAALKRRGCKVTQLRAND